MVWCLHIVNKPDLSLVLWISISGFEWSHAMPSSSAINTKRISNPNLHFISLLPLPPSWIPNPLPLSIPLSTSLWLDLFCRPQSRWAPVCSVPGVCVCVCGKSCHQVQKAKKVEKWNEWERPEQTKIGRSWIKASIHLCKKGKIFTRDLWRRSQRWNRRPQTPLSLWRHPQRGMRPLQMH